MLTRRHVLAAVLCIAVLPGAMAAGAPPALEAQPVFSHPATAKSLAHLLSRVMKPLADAQGLEGEFEQHNFLHGMPRPLLSSGTFLVARGLGVDWHTKKPFNSEVTLTRNALIQRNASGKGSVDKAHQAGLAAVSRTFDALFTLDLPVLEKRFHLYGTCCKKGWTIGLKPRNAVLASHLLAVVVRGSKRPQQVTLYQSHGDRTQIRFEAVQVLQHLSTAQRSRFHSEK